MSDKFALSDLFSKMAQRIDFKITSYGGTILFRVMGGEKTQEFEIIDCAKSISNEEFADAFSAQKINLEIKTGQGRGGALKIYVDNQLMHSAVIGENKTWMWNWDENFSVTGNSTV